MPLRTKQLICRSMFLLLGLVPLFGTVGYATWRYVAFDQGGYQSWIAGQLGLDLRIQDVSHPIPDVVRFVGANVVDPESNEVLARCDELELTQSERAVILRIPSVDVPAGQFRRLLELLHERLLRQSRLLDRPVSVVVESVSLRSESLELVEFRLDAERGTNESLANITFRRADYPDARAVQLHLVRDQRLQPAVTRIELLTKESPLPCSLLFAMPDELRLGNGVTFQGYANLVSGKNGWSGDLAGYLMNLDFGNESPSAAESNLFSGKARAKIDRVEFEDNWMRRLDGKLYANAGQVDRRWLAELIEKLGLDSDSQRLSEVGQAVAFDELGVHFRINGDQAELSGVAGGNTSRFMMLAEDGQPLVGLKNARPIETLRLFRALFRLSDEQVPVSTDQNQLLRMLPLR